MSIENRLTLLEAQIAQLINQRKREPESLRIVRDRTGNHSAVTEELDSLHADIQDLQAGQARLEAGQARLEAGQIELRADVASLQQGQQAVMDKLAEILSKLP